MVEDLERIESLKEYAKERSVPIMLDQGISFLVSVIKDKNVLSILEIGSAIGYSAIVMALSKEDTVITTIEKDTDRYNEAVKNIKGFNLDKRINIINADALDVDLNAKFDLIFIDAAKSKNKDIFLHFKDNLNKDGVIVTDNLKFHGFVDMEPKDVKNRNTRQLVSKIRKYITFLKENTEFKTEFYDVGDGVSLTFRKVVDNDEDAC